MQVLTIKENALTEDSLYIADSGKVFSGNYVAIVEYHTYANEWGDHKHVKRFRKMDTLYKFLDKNYPKLDSDALVFQS